MFALLKKIAENLEIEWSVSGMNNDKPVRTFSGYGHTARVTFGFCNTWGAVVDYDGKIFEESQEKQAVEHAERKIREKLLNKIELAEQLMHGFVPLMTDHIKQLNHDLALLKSTIGLDDSTIGLDDEKPVSECDNRFIPDSTSDSTPDSENTTLPCIVSTWSSTTSDGEEYDAWFDFPNVDQSEISFRLTGTGKTSEDAMLDLYRIVLEYPDWPDWYDWYVKYAEMLDLLVIDEYSPKVKKKHVLLCKRIAESKGKMEAEWKKKMEAESKGKMEAGNQLIPDSTSDSEGTTLPRIVPVSSDGQKFHAWFNFSEVGQSEVSSRLTGTGETSEDAMLDLYRIVSKDPDWCVKHAEMLDLLVIDEYSPKVKKRHIRLSERISEWKKKMKVEDDMSKS